MTDTDKVFFDSNILIYAIDNRDKRKQTLARNLIDISGKNDNGFISTQSLQEFYSVVTRKNLCTPEKAKEFVAGFSEIFTVDQVTLPHIFGAIDISVRNKLSFWDSLILSSADKSGCVVVYSEDLADGQLVNGVKIVNPFAA